MKQSERRGPARQQPTDDHFLEMYHRLPVERQAHHFQEMLRESKEQLQILPYDEVLTDAAFLEEAQRLARGAALAVQDLTQAVNPFRYSSYVARSHACTMGKMTSIDYSRVAEVPETIVYVHAHKEVEFQHSLVPNDFALHILRGEIVAAMDGVEHELTRGRNVEIEAGGPVSVRVLPGSWIIYVDHPLTAYIRNRVGAMEKN